MRGLLLALSVVVSLAAAELALRACAVDVDLQRRLRAGGVVVPYEPGARADLLADEFRVRFAINRFGHRDRLDRRAERTPGVPRLALLGDSFAAGWGVELEETFGYRFEEDTGVEVVNAAKNGGCPLWYVPQARAVSERFRPDWLLVQLFDNDAADNAHYRRRFRLEVGDRVGPLPPHLQPPHGVLGRIAHALDRSHLRDRLRALGRRLRGEAVHRSPFVEPGARPDARILGREEAIAAHDVDFSPDSPWEGGFAFHDPAQQDAWAERLAWNTQLLAQLLDEAAARGERVAFVYVPHAGVFFREPTVNPLAADARALAGRRRAPWIDAREVFARHPRPRELYHAWDGHLNAAGHAALARGLVRQLGPRVTAPADAL